LYFLTPVSDEVFSFQKRFNQHKNTAKLILGANLVCLAAILQAAGGFFPGIGYLLSPLATAPILVCSMFSVPFGAMSYLLTMMVLFILQPTELMIFPFTTGLLGLGIGGAFSFFRKRISIIAAGAMLLTSGIMILLYIFDFPVLGPAFSGSFSFLAAGGILLFSFLYSWFWIEMALLIFARLKRSKVL
jgi:hypothetical protein